MGVCWCVVLLVKTLGLTKQMMDYDQVFKKECYIWFDVVFPHYCVHVAFSPILAGPVKTPPQIPSMCFKHSIRASSAMIALSTCAACCEMGRPTTKNAYPDPHQSNTPPLLKLMLFYFTSVATQVQKLLSGIGQRIAFPSQAINRIYCHFPAMVGMGKQKRRIFFPF